MFKKFLLLFICAVSLGTALNVTTYIYKTVGDVKIDLDVFTPSIAPPAGGYPVVFGLHPGGYIAWGKQIALSTEELNEALNRGWVVVPINYRLFPGVFLEDIFEDVKDAYEWIQTELPKIASVNLDKMIFFGRSAGGGLATLAGAKLSPRPKVIITFYPGFGNWTDSYAYNPETPVNPILVAAANKLSKPVVTEFYPTVFPDPKWTFWNGILDSGKLGWLATTHDPNLPSEQILAKLRELSAVYHLDENYPPTYFAQGLEDTCLPYRMTVEMADVFAQKGIPHVLDLVPGAGHAFDDNTTYWEQHVLPVFDFAQKYIQDAGPKFLEI